MERIVLHTSSRYLYRKLAFGLIGLAAGANLLLYLSRLLGWAIVGLSAIYALIQLRSLGEEVERVVIDDAGIRDSIYPVGVIGWDEVPGLYLTLVGTDGDPAKIAEMINGRVEGRGSR